MFYSLALFGKGRFYIGGKYTTLQACTDSLGGFAKNFVTMDLYGVGCATGDFLIGLGLRLT